MSWVAETQRQKITIGVYESCTPIQGLCRCVLLSRFHEESADAPSCAEVARLLQRRRAQPSAAKWSLDEQVIHKPNEPPVLHAEAEGDDHVSHLPRVRLNEPNLPEPFVGQKRGESFASTLAIQRVSRLGIKLFHQCDEPRQVFRGRFSQNCPGLLRRVFSFASWVVMTLL